MRIIIILAVSMITFATDAVFAASAPTSAAGFTQLFKNKSDLDWSGGDQMCSFKAPNGKTYWCVGDTFLSQGKTPENTYPADTIMVGNRLLLQDGSNMVNAMANNGMAIPDPITANAENHERYWAQAIFYANNHLYVLGQRVIHDPDPNTFGFKLVGVEIAKYNIDPSGKLIFLNMIPTPSSGVVGGIGPTNIQWGADAIVLDHYVYIYGYTGAAQNPYVTHYSYVARVPTDQIEQPAAWRYFKKTTNEWVENSHTLDASTTQADAILAAQISSVRMINHQIVIVYKPWAGFGSAVYADIGKNPQGPFTQQYLFDSPAGVWEGKSYMTYSPMLHPEQTLTGEESGKTLISICWNGVDFFSDTLGNADLYKPRFQTIQF